MTLYVYLMNKLPFEDWDADKIGEAVLDKDLPFEMVGNLDEQGFSPELTVLVLQCLCRDPEKRPNFSQILSSAWFEGRVEEQLSTEPDIE